MNRSNALGMLLGLSGASLEGALPEPTETTELEPRTDPGVQPRETQPRRLDSKARRLRMNRRRLSG